MTFVYHLVGKFNTGDFDEYFSESFFLREREKNERTYFSGKESEVHCTQPNGRPGRGGVGILLDLKNKTSMTFHRGER